MTESNSTDPSIPLGVDGVPLPPMNAVKTAAPPALSSSFGEEDPDAGTA